MCHVAHTIHPPAKISDHAIYVIQHPNGRRTWRTTTSANAVKKIHVLSVHDSVPRAAAGKKYVGNAVLRLGKRVIHYASDVMQRMFEA